jgi:hypothetical protein
MSRIRDIASILTSASVLSTDVETSAAITAAINALPPGYGRGNTASRPVSPTVGDIYVNTQTGFVEIYESTGWSQVGGIASTVTGVTATNSPSERAFNNGAAAITFTPGSVLGKTYVVTSSPGSYTASGTASPITITGLQSSTQYTYTVVASNNYGTASASSASSAVTATTVPQAPSITSVTGGNAQVSVAFSANATGGSAITGYTVTSSPGNFTASGSSSPLIVTGLTNGTGYTFTVTATNTNGTSLASSASSSATPAVPNYFGTGADGAVTIASNTSLTVPNKVGSYDGDMLVRNYSSLTINSGVTLTTDQPCRGMLIYVTGNCTINGTLSMTARGAFADPTTSGGSDGNAVSSSGLQLPFVTASGTDTISTSAALLNGCGTAARSAIANHSNLASNGKVIILSRQGALGGGGGAGGNYHHMGSNGLNGSLGQTGGGGGGRGGYADTTGSGGSGGGGSYGSCFAGGSGGGSGNYPGQNGGAATAWAGKGGNGGGTANYIAGGGLGNPNGDPAGNSGAFPTAYSNLVPGVGGLIILIVGGNLTIGSGGSIVAKGNDSPPPSTYGTAGNAGGSGGGNVVLAYRGSYTNSGTVSVAGGAQSHAADDRSGASPVDGGGGGNGSLQTLQVL